MNIDHCVSAVQKHAWRPDISIQSFHRLETDNIKEAFLCWGTVSPFPFLLSFSSISSLKRLFFATLLPVQPSLPSSNPLPPRGLNQQPSDESLSLFGPVGSFLTVNWSSLSVSQNWDSALPDVGLGVCCGKFTAVKSEPAPAWPTVFWDVLHGAGQRHVSRREPSVSRCSCSGKQEGKATLFPLKKGHSETVRLCSGSFLRGVSQDGRLTAP